MALGGAATVHGFGGGPHLTYGLTDAFDLLAEINFNAYPGGDLLMPSVGVGAGYVVDILQWVPRVGLLVGAADLWTLGAAGGHDFRFAPAAVAGLDYQFTRSFALGVGGRYQLLIGGAPLVHVINAFVRAEYTWGY